MGSPFAIGAATTNSASAPDANFFRGVLYGARFKSSAALECMSFVETM